MFDCSNEITDYYNDRVILSEAQREQLRGFRRSNEDRLKCGLAAAGKPAPKKFIKQGSYAMRTTIQRPGNNYDIDDGVVFDPAKLVQSNGDPMSSLQARQMVCDALQDERFNRQPEVRSNCVRVYYNEGYHVDMPVYREKIAWDGTTTYELASSDWREADPTAVTEWFNSAVVAKSPDELNGRQMRRVVCLLKAFACSRSTWNMPSGFVISALVDECYSADDGRDDQSFFDTMSAMRNRLNLTTTVLHPVTGATLAAAGDSAVVQLRDKLAWALDEVLAVLNRSDCSRLDALKAWKKAFNTDYFDGMISEEEEKQREAVSRLAAAIKDPPRQWSSGL